MLDKAYVNIKEGLRKRSRETAFPYRHGKYPPAERMKIYSAWDLTN